MDRNTSERYAVVSEGEKRVVVPISDFDAGQQQVIKKLREVGIIIVAERAKNDLKNRVQAIQHWREAHVVSERGWHKAGKVFVLTRQCVFGAKADRNDLEIVMDEDTGKWRSRGTHKEWLANAKLMVGQSRIIFLVCFQFVPPVLDIISRFHNIGVELVGDPGIGKTSASGYALSVWGGDPTRDTGWAESWSTTLEGLELTIRLHRYAMLGLEEINLLGSLDDRNTRQRAETAVFRLAHGVEKARHGRTANPRETLK